MTYATRSRAYRYTRIANIAVVLLAVVLQQGCSRIIPKLDEVVPDNRKAYQKAETLPDLEVPPDLSTDAIRDRMAIPDGGDSARYSTYQERRADVQRELADSDAGRGDLREHRRLVAAPGPDLQHIAPGRDLKRFGHDRHDQRLGDGLSSSDGQRTVRVGQMTVLQGHKLMARHRAHRREHLGR